MTKVSRISDKAAQDALRILEDAWSYYTPEPLLKSDLDRPRPVLFQYYNAA